MKCESQHDFLQAVTLEQPCNFHTDKLKVEVNKRRYPLVFTCYFSRIVNGHWERFCTSISNYSGDIVQDIKNELIIYN